jgi:hypothetical protein
VMLFVCLLLVHSPLPCFTSTLLIPIMQDWAGREFIQVVQFNVLKMTNFLNKFGKCTEQLPVCLRMCVCV